LFGASQISVVSHIVVPQGASQSPLTHVAPVGQWLFSKHCSHEYAGRPAALGRMSQCGLAGSTTQSALVKQSTQRLFGRSQMLFDAGLVLQGAAVPHPILPSPDASAAPDPPAPPMPAPPAPPDPAVPDPPLPAVPVLDAPLPAVPVAVPEVESSPPQDCSTHGVTPSANASQ
jgi:hypothetical protein